MSYTLSILFCLTLVWHPQIGEANNLALSWAPFIYNESVGWHELDSTRVPVVVNHITGRIWMDRNLGASRPALNIYDRDAFGHLYQWGRSGDGHQLRLSDTTNIVANTLDTSIKNAWHGKFIVQTNEDFHLDWITPQNDSIWSEETFNVTNVCPEGFRIPTEQEWEEERESWTSNSAFGAFHSPLKLTTGGERHFIDGTTGDIGLMGGYWSSDTEGPYARVLTIQEFSAFFITEARSYGHSVRCIKGPDSDAIK